MNNTNLNFTFCSEELEFSISQKGFFNKHTELKISVPLENLTKFRDEILNFFSEWKTEIEGSKNTSVPMIKHLTKKIEFDENFYLELEEGIANYRNELNDRFGIYDNFESFAVESPSFGFSDVKVIVIPFWFVPVLIEIIDKGENYNTQILV